MAGQVPIVSILMIVHGAMLSLMGLLYAIMGPALFAMMQIDKQNVRGDDQAFMGVMSGVYIGCGVVMLAIGILHVTSGIMALRYRSRILAIVTLFTNVVALWTCYCAPTGLAVMIFGLIVFFNHEVAEAFRMVGEGASIEQALEAVDRSRGFERRDDFRRDEDDRRDNGWSDRRDEPPGPPDERIRPA